jgi:hypothetical protein
MKQFLYIQNYEHGDDANIGGVIFKKNLKVFEIYASVNYACK